VPQSLDGIGPLPGIVVTVCDQAHEELAPDESWLHWSVPDPVPDGSRAAFDAAARELRDRITGLLTEQRKLS
jgi:protein-tyrosine-phosphatase